MNEPITGYRTLFTAEPHERIVSMTRFRDKVLVATDRRILEWNADNETWQAIEIVHGEALGEADLVKIGERRSWYYG